MYSLLLNNILNQSQLALEAKTNCTQTTMDALMETADFKVTLTCEILYHTSPFLYQNWT